jgi:hypothetical protein
MEKMIEQKIKDDEWNGIRMDYPFGSNNYMLDAKTTTKEPIVSSILKHTKLKSLKKIIDTIDSKNGEYAKDPMDYISLDDLLAQIRIKDVRFNCAKSKEKRLDELLDSIVYRIYAYEKLLGDPEDEFI